MKKVLIIAYYFPPLGGAGVQRTLKFVKYLSEFNYISVILTPNPKLIRYISHDYTLIEEIPKETRIYNSFIVDLNWIFKILYGFKLKRIVNYINETLLFPDYQIQWLPFAKKQVKEIMKKEKIDIVYITSPPHSTQLLGEWIQKIYHVPIVVDFRDPLTFNYEKRSSDLYRKCFDCERNILNNADFIIANTPVNKKNYTKWFNISENKISVITNGFDSDDFKNFNKKRKNDDKIIFLHIGQLYGKYNAAPLLLTLNKIKNKLKNVEFRFVGKITPKDKKMINSFKLNEIVKVINYCSHSKALEYIQESDYLIILLADLNWRFWIPGKTFEYINSEREILAIVPEDGSCAKIIRETKTGIVISPDSIDKIALIILNFIENNYKKNFNPDYNKIEKYERKRLTERLANIFNNVIEKKYEKENFTPCS